MLTALKSFCKEMIIVGNKKRIPYINRTPMCPVRLFNPLEFTPGAEVLNTLYRCTRTVAALLYEEYDGGMHAVSEVVCEMRRKPFTSLSAIDKMKNTKYLTFKLSDRMEMQRMGFDVSTIHEFQGKQADNIVVIRTSSRREEIYDSSVHSLVAITRYRKTFTYISLVSDDAISRFITRSNLLDQSQIKKARPLPKTGRAFWWLHSS